MHHRTVDTLGIMLGAGTIPARCAAVRHAISRLSSPSRDLMFVRCMPLDARLSGGGVAGLISDAQVNTRRLVDSALDALSAGSAARPVHASGMSSACSARCGSGRCARGGAAGRCDESARREFSSQRWVFWRRVLAMEDGDNQNKAATDLIRSCKFHGARDGRFFSGSGRRLRPGLTVGFSQEQAFDRRR